MESVLGYVARDSATSVGAVFCMLIQVSGRYLKVVVGTRGSVVRCRLSSFVRVLLACTGNGR